MDIKTNFIIICEQAFLSAGSNNLNLIGIFTNINAEKFPITHPKFSVAMNFGTDARGKHEMAADIVGPEGKKLANIKLPITITASPFQLIANFANLSFPSPGAYEIKLSIDGQSLGSRVITVNPVIQQKANFA